MKILKWLTGVCAVLMATSAYPQDRVGDMYVGAAPGMVLYPELEEHTGKFENELRQEGHNNINNLSLSTDDRAFAWSAFAGYALNDDNGLGLLLGGGLDVPVTDAASFRIEYLYLPLSDDHGGDEHRAHLGAFYSF